MCQYCNKSTTLMQDANDRGNLETLYFLLNFFCKSEITPKIKPINVKKPKHLVIEEKKSRSQVKW